MWRFYLLYVRPEVQDTEFQWADFQLKNNSELLNNLGNFVNRAISFVAKFYDHKLPLVQINGAQRAWVTKVNEGLAEYRDAMESNRQRDALRSVLAVSRLGNQLIQQWQPWVKGRVLILIFEKSQKKIISPYFRALIYHDKTLNEQLCKIRLKVKKAETKQEADSCVMLAGKLFLAGKILKIKFS